MASGVDMAKGAGSRAPAAGAFGSARGVASRSACRSALASDLGLGGPDTARRHLPIHHSITAPSSGDVADALARSPSRRTVMPCSRAGDRRRHKRRGNRTHGACAPSDGPSRRTDPAVGQTLARGGQSA